MGVHAMTLDLSHLTAATRELACNDAKNSDFIGANGPLGYLPAGRNRRRGARTTIPLSNLCPHALHAALRG